MHLFLKTRPFDFHLDQIFGLEEGGFMYVTVGIFFLFVRYLTEIKKNDWQFTVVCFEKRELNTDAITMFYQQQRRNDFSRELGIFWRHFSWEF